MLVLDFHRHRQKRIEHGLEIAAHAERRRAAGQEQSSTEVGDEPRQRSERLRAGLASRYVLQDDRAKSQQAGRILRHLRRPDRADAQLAGRQGTAQVVRPSAGVDHQDRRRRFDAHGAVAPVVLGDAIAPGRELQPVAGDAGPIDEVPKRQLGGARLKAACGARDLDAVTQQDGLGVDRAIGAHRRGELKRLPLVDHAGQVERFDGDVRRLAAAEHPEVDRQAARRRFVCCPHHRRSVRLAVREHDQPAAPLARDQTGGKTNRTSQVAAVAVHLLHERARLTQLLGQSLDARLASVGHDSDSIARRAPLLEQADDLERPATAVCRHRPREIGDDDDVDAFAAERRQWHRRDQCQQDQHQHAHVPAERGGPAAPEVQEQQRDEQEQELGIEEGQAVHAQIDRRGFRL